MKHTHIIGPSNLTHGYWQWWNKTLGSHKYLNISIYRTSVHPKLETTQMSFNQEMDKQTMVFPSNGILVSREKGKTIDTCSNLNGPQKKVSFGILQLLWFHLYDIVGKTNNNNGKRVSDCQGLEVGGRCYHNWDSRGCLSWFGSGYMNQFM